MTLKNVLTAQLPSTGCIDSDGTVFTPSQMIDRVKVAANNKNLLRTQAWMQGEHLWACVTDAVYICQLDI